MKKLIKKKNKNIKERTRIVTAQITFIDKISDESKPSTSAIAAEFKDLLCADDVVVTSVKDFILEKN